MSKARIFEYRGVKGLVAAEVLVDDNETGAGHGYVTDTPFSIAGVANVSSEVENSSDTHYYDNYGAIVVTSEGATTVTVSASGLSPEIYAKITGYQYNPNTGGVIEGKRQVKYFALGYQYEDTDGHEYYRWFYKGMFQIPSATHITMNNGTDANGQSVVYTAVRTAHNFVNANGDNVKTMAIDGTLGLADVSNFFTEVTTPDTITQSTSYELSVTVGQGTNLRIAKTTPGGVEYLSDGEVIYAGDQLKITCTNGTITVNGTAFISGDIHVVAGNTAIVSTYSG